MKRNEERAIFVLSGGLRKDESGKWVTTDFGTEYGIFGDRMRVTAASYLYKENPNTLVIASGGWGRQREGISDAPKLCGVMKRELIELGVEARNIAVEDRSNTTHEQIKELKKIIIGQKFTAVTIVTNEYHLPRVRAFIEYDNELNRVLSGGRLRLRSAEEILLKHEPSVWKKVIEDAYRSEAMRRRMELEHKGIEDLRVGRYKF